MHQTLFTITPKKVDLKMTLAFQLSALLLLPSVSAFGFPPMLGGGGTTLSRRLPTLNTVALEEVDETTKQDSSSACLNLVGFASFESAPAPLATPDTLLEFFQLDQNRNCLVSGGNNKPCIATSPSPELLQIWREKAALNGGAEPNENDVLLQVNTGGMKMPGITISSVAVIGCKLLSNANAFPVFEFVLVDDEQQVEGSKPIVWIFNQLTAASKKGDKAKKKDGPLSITRVSAKLSSDQKAIVFFSEGYIKISVKFPAVLLKILPVSREKAEEQGSTAIQRVIEKDGQAGLFAFRDSFEAWTMN